MRWLKGKGPDELVSRSEVTEQLGSSGGEVMEWEAFMMTIIDDHIGPIRARDLYQFVRHMIKGEDTYPNDTPILDLWTKTYDWEQIRRLGESAK